MKNLIYLILFFNCSTSTQMSGQSLTGIWQKGSKEIGSSELDRYHFFEDGKFIYYFNGYDGANRILAIKGTYEIKGSGDLIFRVSSFIQREGGFFSKTTSSIEHNGWTLMNYGKVNEVKQQITEINSWYEECEKSDVSQCIMIDEDKFYKMEGKPEDFYK
jgi:hypothetical protein